MISKPNRTGHEDRRDTTSDTPLSDSRPIMGVSDVKMRSICIRVINGKLLRERCRSSGGSVFLLKRESLYTESDRRFAGSTAN